MHPDFYQQLQTPTHAADGLSIIQRSLDGLGFRLYWALKGMRAEDYTFRPSEDSMTISDLSIHLSHLVKKIGKMLNCSVDTIPDQSDEDRAAHTLSNLVIIRHAIMDKDLALIAQDESFWNLFNGPLADAISHTGQLNSWRRLNGNPIHKVSFFSGRAPQAPV